MSADGAEHFLFKSESLPVLDQTDLNHLNPPQKWAQTRGLQLVSEGLVLVGVIDKEESPVWQLLLALAVPTSSFSPPHHHPPPPFLVRGSGWVPDLHVLGLNTPPPLMRKMKEVQPGRSRRPPTPHLFPALIGPEATSSCRLSAALGEIWL